MHDVDRGIDISALDVDVQDGNAANPRLILDLDGVVTKPDDQVRAAQKSPLHLAPRAFYATDRKRMVFIYQSLRHRRRCKRNAVTLDESTQ